MATYIAIDEGWLYEVRSTGASSCGVARIPIPDRLPWQGFVVSFAINVLDLFFADLNQHCLNWKTVISS
jgi:hypothetical protein